MKQLTQKQENFARYYVECANYTEAYKRAYNTSKMKPNVINVKAFELFNNGNVTVRIEELQKEAQERNQVTIDRIVQELSKIAFIDMNEFTKKSNTIKLADKTKSLDLLMKHLGGYRIDNNQKITQIEIIRKTVR